MIYLFLFALFVIACVLIVSRPNRPGEYRDPDATGIALASAFAVWLIVNLITAKLIGVLPDYGSGERLGYVTKVSNQGAIWKTWEVEAQMGGGNQAAIQEPIHFSIGQNDAIAKTLKDNLGKQARIHYRQWLIVPFHVGSSGKEITSIEFQEK